jgi:hypothetical protein
MIYDLDDLKQLVEKQKPGTKWNRTWLLKELLWALNEAIRYRALWRKSLEDATFWRKEWEKLKRGDDG